MRNVMLVIKHEIMRTIAKPSFWIMSFIFPLVIFAFSFGSQLLAREMAENGAAKAKEDSLLVGYVDQAGIISELPPEIPAGMLIPYASIDAADAALADGEIGDYYIVPADFRETGDVTLVQGSFSPFEGLEDNTPLRYILIYNLVGDPDVAALLLDPVPSLRTESILPPEETAGGGTGQPSLAPILMLFVFFFVLTFSSGFMLHSVTREKENRVAEVLLVSLNPRELMLGKILGLGVVALLQMALWLGGALVILREGVPMIGLASQVLAATLPPHFLLWAALYFIFGYLAFASLLGALGTLAPNMREGSQYTFVVMLPLMIPMFVSQSFMMAPNGKLATVLSILPLTSPVSMIARLAGTPVPIWQILLSLALMAATTYGFVLLAARFFRSDTLLSSEALNLKRIRGELFGSKS